MLARKLKNYENDYEYGTVARDKYGRGQYAENCARTRTVAREDHNTALRRQVALLVFMTLLFAFYMVMRSDVFIQNGYELTKLKQQEVELIKKIEYLQVNLTKAKAPERITVLAEKLGMTAADRNMYVKTAGAGDEKQAERNE
jgi:cell division protein FtsL